MLTDGNSRWWWSSSPARRHPFTTAGTRCVRRGQRTQLLLSSGRGRTIAVLVLSGRADRYGSGRRRSSGQRPIPRPVSRPIASTVRARASRGSRRIREPRANAARRASLASTFKSRSIRSLGGCFWSSRRRTVSTLLPYHPRERPFPRVVWKQSGNCSSPRRPEAASERPDRSRFEGRSERCSPGGVRSRFSDPPRSTRRPRAHRRSDGPRHRTRNRSLTRRPTSAGAVPVGPPAEHQNSDRPTSPRAEQQLRPLPTPHAPGTGGREGVTPRW